MQDGGYYQRKLERTVDYVRRNGVGSDTCVACNGSGHYDHDGSPACASCDGKGRQRRQLRSRETALSAIAAERAREALVLMCRKMKPDWPEMGAWYKRQIEIERTRIGLHDKT